MISQGRNNAIIPVYWIGLFILCLLNGYYIYSDVLKYIKHWHGERLIANGTWGGLRISEAIYYLSYSVAIYVSITGLLLKEKWAYIFFNILAIPAGIFWMGDIYSQYREHGSVEEIDLVAVLILAIVIFLLNRFRRILINGNSRYGMITLVIVIAGIAVNFGVFILMLRNS